MAPSTTTTVKLNREWQLGPQFDRGGMGVVYEATGDDGSAAVIKLIRKDPRANRELLFVNLSSANVIPILDFGDWNDSLVLVMPRAEISLAKHLENAGGQLSLDDALPILTDVAEALAGLENDVVHRDLKPDNILFYNGKWCVADFGIARYAEAATASDTHKFAMTPAYAAPEQWKQEHATPATDIYSFGVVAFELTQGSLPFIGPDPADFRAQHIGSPPPQLVGVTPSFASVITECLTKTSPARPTAANILARLQKAGETSTPGGSKLQEIQRQAAERQAQETARESAEEDRNEARAQLFAAARQSLQNVIVTLRDTILEHAPLAKVIDTSGPLKLELEAASLTVDPPKPSDFNCLVQGKFSAPFDVIGHSAIAVNIAPDKSGYCGRAHSLWYCDAHEEGVYRWFELAFMLRPSMGQSFRSSPAALDPTAANARVALSPMTGACLVAREPIPIDQGEEPDFIERWLNYFADAAGGALVRPRVLPEHTGGHRRTAQ